MCIYITLCMSLVLFRISHWISTPSSLAIFPSLLPPFLPAVFQFHHCHCSCNQLASVIMKGKRMVRYVVHILGGCIVFLHQISLQKCFFPSFSSEYSRCFFFSSPSVFWQLWHISSAFVCRFQNEGFGHDEPRTAQYVAMTMPSVSLVYLTTIMF